MNLRQKLGTAAILCGMVVGVGGLTGTAQAQYRNYSPYGQHYAPGYGHGYAPGYGYGYEGGLSQLDQASRDLQQARSIIASTPNLGDHGKETLQSIDNALKHLQQSRTHYMKNFRR